MIEKTRLGAYAVIKNNNEILLIKKSRGAYTGKLDLPGGGIEHGEDPNDTVVREVYEEVGATVLTYKLIDVASANTKWIRVDQKEHLHHIGIIYDVTIDMKEEIKTTADGQDSLGAAWYKISDLTEDQLSPFAKKYTLNK